MEASGISTPVLSLVTEGIQAGAGDRSGSPQASKANDMLAEVIEHYPVVLRGWRRWRCKIPTEAIENKNCSAPCESSG